MTFCVRFIISTPVQQVYAAYAEWKHQHMRLHDYNKTILQTSAGTQEVRLMIKIHSCLEVVPITRIKLEKQPMSLVFIGTQC